MGKCCQRHCQDTAWVKGSPGAMEDPSNGKSWQPRPIPPPQPEAGQTKGTEAAPFSCIPGSSDRLGCRPAGGPGSGGTRLSRSGLLGLVRAITGTGAESPGGLTWAPELWAEWGGPRAKNTGRADSVSGTQQAQRAKSWTTACPGCPAGQARDSLKGGVAPETAEPLSFNPMFQQYQSHCHLCFVSSLLAPTAYTQFVYFGLGSFIATLKPLFFSSALIQPILFKMSITPPQAL